VNTLKQLISAFLVLLIFSATSIADSGDEGGMTADEFLGSLDYRHGTIDLDNGLASIDLMDGFAYLSPDDTERVLVDAWGNPPGNETLGMIVPTDRTVLDEDSWVAIITYEASGHVSDKEAEKIDYGELLQSMQEDTRETNAARVDAGYASIELVGWAAEPYYDKANHKLQWAKELKFGDSPDNTLNYNVRVLGREGVLNLNIVTGSDMLGEVDAQLAGILAMAEFRAGNLYTDFDPKVDKVAAYGIAALIAGKVAGKAGILAKLGVILLAFKKAWLLVIVAIGAFFKKLFGKKETFTLDETTRGDMDKL
jgi:uncharacterized membrane-anchored protein